MDFKGLAKNILENAVSSAIVMSVGLQDKINFPNNEVGISVKNGLVMTGSEQLLEMYNRGSSKVDRQDWVGLADDIVYNGAVFWGLNKSNVASTLVNSVNDLSPLDAKYNEALVSGALLAGATTARDIIDNNPNWNTTSLTYLTHPVSRLFN